MSKWDNTRKMRWNVSSRHGLVHDLLNTSNVRSTHMAQSHDTSRDKSIFRISPTYIMIVIFMQNGETGFIAVRADTWSRCGLGLCGAWRLRVTRWVVIRYFLVYSLLMTAVYSSFGSAAKPPQHDSRNSLACGKTSVEWKGIWVLSAINCPGVQLATHMGVYTSTSVHD